MILPLLVLWIIERGFLNSSDNCGFVYYVLQFLLHIFQCFVCWWISGIFWSQYISYALIIDFIIPLSSFLLHLFKLCYFYFIYTYNTHIIFFFLAPHLVFVLSLKNKYIQCWQDHLIKFSQSLFVLVVECRSFHRKGSWICYLLNSFIFKNIFLNLIQLGWVLDNWLTFFHLELLKMKLQFRFALHFAVYKSIAHLTYFPWWFPFIIKIHFFSSMS